VSVTKPAPVLARSELPSDSIIRTERRRPVLSLTEQLALSLGLRDGPATGCRAVG
jgi:hypothetical protein